MDFDKLVADYNGQEINDYGGECVALIAHYCLDNGFPIAYANACDWWNHPSLTGAFDFIANDPNDLSQLPPHGAVMIWGSSLPGSGRAGHIAAFDASTGAGTFRSLDNNWGGRYVHFVSHSWGYIIGWMVPKSAPAPQGDTMIPDQDNWYERFGKLMLQIRGRGLGRAEFQKNFVGVEPFHMVEILSDDPEADAATQISLDEPAVQAQLNAIKDTVNQQNQTITSISAHWDASKQQLKDALDQIAKDNADLATAHDKIIELQKQPSPAPIVAPKPNPLVEFFKKLLGIK